MELELDDRDAHRNGKANLYILSYFVYNFIMSSRKKFPTIYSLLYWSQTPWLLIQNKHSLVVKLKSSSATRFIYTLFYWPKDWHTATELVLTLRSSMDWTLSDGWIRISYLNYLLNIQYFQVNSLINWFIDDFLLLLHFPLVNDQRSHNGSPPLSLYSNLM